MSVASLVLGVLVAYASSVLLLRADVQNSGIRFGLSFLIAYAAMLLVIGLWFHTVSPVKAKELVMDGHREISTRVPGDSAVDDKMQLCADEAKRAVARNAHGLIGVYVAAGVAGCLYIGIHFFYHAPWYLGKLLVEGGKVQHPASPEATPYCWIVLPFLYSYPVGLLMGLHYLSVGYILETFQASQ